MKTSVLMIFGIMGLLFCRPLNAQSDTVRNFNDTSSFTNAEVAVQLLIKADSIALSDSINEVVLSKQLKELHSNQRSKLEKEFITIPNSNILASNVINYSNSKLQVGLVLHTTVTIGYDVPWRKVHQILTCAAKKTSYLNPEIAPFVHQTSLDDFYVSYQLNAHTNEPDKQPGIYSELHENIQDGFNEAGIEIMSPHYRAGRDGNSMAIPKDYLPEGYVTPGFKIEDNKNTKKQ